MQLVNGSPTGPIVSSARFGIASANGIYASTAVPNDVVVVNYDSATSIIFALGITGQTGVEKVRINRYGYTGIATTAPTAKLHVNCTALAGQSNPSNIRFQNLQGGSGKYLVIDSNGYVYKSTTGPGGASSAPSTQTAAESATGE